MINNLVLVDLISRHFRSKPITISVVLAIQQGPALASRLGIIPSAPLTGLLPD